MFFIAGRKSYPTFGQSGFAWISSGVWYANITRTFTAPSLDGIKLGDTGGGSIASSSGETAPTPARMPSFDMNSRLLQLAHVFVLLRSFIIIILFFVT